MQYIKVYTMPVWYIAVYDGTSRYENLIPGYTGIYRDIRNRMVLSRWWGFQMGPGGVQVTSRSPQVRVSESGRRPSAAVSSGPAGGHGPDRERGDLSRRPRGVRGRHGALPQRRPQRTPVRSSTPSSSLQIHICGLPSRAHQYFRASDPFPRA